MLENVDVGGACFCPPESWAPRGPTSVSSPSGKSPMKSQFARLAAARICCAVAPGAPYAIFSANVPEYKTGSCGTTEMCRRNCCYRDSELLYLFNTVLPYIYAIQSYLPGC